MSALENVEKNLTRSLVNVENNLTGSLVNVEHNLSKLLLDIVNHNSESNIKKNIIGKSYYSVGGPFFLNDTKAVRKDGEPSSLYTFDDINVRFTDLGNSFKNTPSEYYQIVTPWKILSEKDRMIQFINNIPTDKGWFGAFQASGAILTLQFNKDFSAFVYAKEYFGVVPKPNETEDDIFINIGNILHKTKPPFFPKDKPYYPDGGFKTGDVEEAKKYIKETEEIAINLEIISFLNLKNNFFVYNPDTKTFILPNGTQGYQSIEKLPISTINVVSEEIFKNLPTHPN